MARARRKMRRQLMKKMRKGYLTPGERSELKDLDREVNQLNRRAAGVTGLGATAALAMAERSGLLDQAGESIGAFLDKRREGREQAAAEEAAAAQAPVDAFDASLTDPNEMYEGELSQPEGEDAPLENAATLSDYSPEEVEASVVGPPTETGLLLEHLTRFGQPGHTFRVTGNMTPTDAVESMVKKEHRLNQKFSQAEGGYAPFLRAMRDRIRRKHTRR